MTASHPRLKTSECSSALPRTLASSLYAKNGISPTNKMAPTTNTPFQLPPPMLGKLATIVFPCWMPTSVSSAILKHTNNSQNTADL